MAGELIYFAESISDPTQVESAAAARLLAALRGRRISRRLDQAQQGPLPTVEELEVWRQPSGFKTHPGVGAKPLVVFPAGEARRKVLPLRLVVLPPKKAKG